MLRSKRVSSLKCILYSLIILLIIWITGLWMYTFETDFNSNFEYPYEDDDFLQSVDQLRKGLLPKIAPVNTYNYSFIKNPSMKCNSEEPIQLVYMVKSAPDNFAQRSVLRKTWGYEKRFSDVTIRTVFMLGLRSDKALLESVDEEFKMHKDILQGQYVDTYFNNTIKTMMGFKWAVNYCNKARFYVFVDDDYYVSTKNILRFLRHPTEYPEYLKTGIRDIQFELPEGVKLYAGNIFHTRPIRIVFNKWYVTLNEYQYNRWPPYATGGTYILSREALKDLYYASFYTKHFRFDDVYVGLLAYRMKILPLHSNYFPAYPETYVREKFKFYVAAHGFKDTLLLDKVWSDQKSSGFA